MTPEVLSPQQELLNARGRLITVQRDSVVASYAVAQASGGYRQGRSPSRPSVQREDALRPSKDLPGGSRVPDGRRLGIGRSINIEHSSPLNLNSALLRYRRQWRTFYAAGYPGFSGVYARLGDRRRRTACDTCIPVKLPALKPTSGRWSR
jgi:hypothetical protein